MHRLQQHAMSSLQVRDEQRLSARRNMLTRQKIKETYDELQLCMQHMHLLNRYIFLKMKPDIFNRNITKHEINEILRMWKERCWNDLFFYCLNQKQLDRFDETALVTVETNVQQALWEDLLDNILAFFQQNIFLFDIKIAEVLV